MSAISKYLTMLLALIVFSQNVFAKRGIIGLTKVNIASIENSAEPLLYKLDAELNKKRDITAFIKSVYKDGRLVRGQSMRFPLGSMKMGVLVEKLGFKVLKYDPSLFTSHKGGVLTIYYARDFIKSRFTNSAYGKIKVEVLRNGDSWGLYDSKGNEVDYIYVKVTKNFFGMPKGISHIKFMLKNKSKI